MKRLHFLLGGLAVTGLVPVLIACGRSNGASRPALPASGRLTVLVTGTVWGNLEPCG
jgi:hypothetical protein